MTPGTSKQITGKDLADVFARLKSAIESVKAYKTLDSLGLDANIILSPTPEDAKVQAAAEDAMKGQPYRIIKGDPTDLNKVADAVSKDVGKVVVNAVLTHIIGKL